MSIPPPKFCFKEIQGGNVIPVGQIVHEEQLRVIHGH
jgi:hypothetical protein